MEQNEEIEMQIWEYIDGTCNDADKLRISVLIAQNIFWKEHYEELLALHTGISGNLETEQPTMRFTKNVMEAIAAEHIAPATRKYINKGIIRGIAALFIIMLTVTFGYALATANWHTGSSELVSKFSTDKIGLSTFFNSSFFNLVIGVNIILGLVLVDKLLRKRTSY